MRTIEQLSAASRSRRLALRLAAMGLACAALAPAAAVAQDFPNRPVKVIVTYPPGGGTDVLARLIAPVLAENLGQAVVIENKGGAGGSIGAAAAARAPADGYTVLFASALPHTAVAGMYQKLPYSPTNDFAGVGLATTLPYVIVANTAVPAKNLAELLALVRAKPGVLNFESAGIGSSTHLVGELFKKAFKVNLMHVPFTGGGPGLSALLADQVQLGFENLAAMVPYIQSGKLRAIAVTGAHRSPLLPNVPTIAESGYPDFTVTGQFGYLVPAGVPKPVIARLNAALDKTMKNPAVVAQLAKLGAEAETSTPEAFDKLMKEESAKWLGMIKELGIKAE
ncbi:MAG: tripartite tricarboxylate transporter substrate binding protein [Rubrivivax sp.]|nr:tripartite tricarboxylate transporter substrate binding protein [Rubrivivax sp.]